jgi:hypothetical protein
MRKALVVYGGWGGHEPEKVGPIEAELLRAEGFQVETSTTLDAYTDEKKMTSLDLVVQHWTMGKITGEQCKGLCKAVSEDGVGLAGLHGGLCDSFREATEYQFMTGGQWVAHPGNIIDYRVHIVDHADPITAGLDHFNMKSEQYYMHVDPSNRVLATTTFEHNGCTMPCVWKRKYGKGRVFFSSLGHVAKDLDAFEPREMLRRGMLWAAESKYA